MYYFKKLIIPLLILNILSSADLPFRGSSKDYIITNNIPLAFSNMILSNYDILPSQINPQRGSYLIIAPDGVVNYLDEFVSFKKSQGFDVYLKSLSESGGNAAEVKNTIYNVLMSDPML